MKSSLDSRERVMRALTHQDHDRIPRFDQIWPETRERWKSEGMVGDPADLFDWDIAWCGWVSAMPYPGRHEIVSEDAETKDVIGQWGQRSRWWKHRQGTPTHLGWECQSQADWEAEIKPRLTLERQNLDLEVMREKYRIARAADRFVCCCGIQSYEATKAMLGDELMMMSFADDPDWVSDISRTYTDIQIALFERMLAAGIQPDALWIFEDLAYSNGPLCSPRMYRELVWPDHRRMCDFAHANGMKFIFHTDGDINTYLGLFADAGFDCLQPLEAKAKVDIRELAPEWGSRFSFFGNIDMMVAITNDADKVEEEVRSKLAAGMEHKGYLYHSDHSVPPQVSWTTYQWIMNCVERYGVYT